MEICKAKDGCSCKKIKYKNYIPPELKSSLVSSATDWEDLYSASLRPEQLENYLLQIATQEKIQIFNIYMKPRYYGAISIMNLVKPFLIERSLTALIRAKKILPLTRDWKSGRGLASYILIKQWKLNVF